MHRTSQPQSYAEKLALLESKMPLFKVLVAAVEAKDQVKLEVENGVVA